MSTSIYLLERAYSAFKDYPKVEEYRKYDLYLVLKLNGTRHINYFWTLEEGALYYYNQQRYPEASAYIGEASLSWQTRSLINFAKMHSEPKGLPGLRICKYEDCLVGLWPVIVNLMSYCTWIVPRLCRPHFEGEVLL